MTLADQYAKAVYELVRNNPAEASAYMTNLRATLKRRDHEKLLPRIAAAYENLETSEKRRTRLAEVTPEMRRTRTLIELYKKLISA